MLFRSSYACEIAHNALVFYNDDSAAPELHTDPTLLVGHMRALCRRHKGWNRALGVTLALAALLLIWDLRRFGLSNPERLFSDIYLSLILLAGLFTLLLDRESLQKLKRMEADMEAGIAPERLPTSPRWRRRQRLRGIVQIFFFATIFLAPLLRPLLFIP